MAGKNRKRLSPKLKTSLGILGAIALGLGAARVAPHFMKRVANERAHEQRVEAAKYTYNPAEANMVRYAFSKSKTNSTLVVNLANELAREVSASPIEVAYRLNSLTQYDSIKVPLANQEARLKKLQSQKAELIKRKETTTLTDKAIRDAELTIQLCKQIGYNRSDLDVTLLLNRAHKAYDKTALTVLSRMRDREGQ